MKRTLFCFIAFSFMLGCSGPKYFNSPTDYVGGNRAAAVHTHCVRQAGQGKDSLIYKLCEQSFNTHYGE